MRSGQIDAISNLDPVITLLARSGDLKIVSDTRVVSEADKIFRSEERRVGKECA